MYFLTYKKKRYFMSQVFLPQFKSNLNSVSTLDGEHILLHKPHLLIPILNRLKPSYKSRQDEAHLIQHHLLRGTYPSPALSWLSSQSFPFWTPKG